jgi:hypothetical protein
MTLHLRTKVQLWVLLLIQVLCLFVAADALSRLGSVLFDFALSTRSCPDGVYAYMSMDTRRECSGERVGLYLPDWVVPCARGTIMGSLLCVGCGSAWWIARRVRRSPFHSYEFIVGCQILVLIVAFFVFHYGLWFGPLDTLKLVVRGVLW